MKISLINISMLGIQFYCQLFISGSQISFHVVRKQCRLENRCTEIILPASLCRAMKDHRKLIGFRVLYVNAVCQADLNPAFTFSCFTNIIEL